MGFGIGRRAMRKKLAFVLSGGGGRGALQVGALKALTEAGIRPQMLVGTSIGAVNAAFLALGPMEERLKRLERIWLEEVPHVNLLPRNPLLLTYRILNNRLRHQPDYKARDMLSHYLANPDVCFGEISHVELYVVATDLLRGSVRVYGVDPKERVLDGVWASSTLPPWMPPIMTDKEMLMDGGLVSNLPIQVAISRGATEIFALDLSEPKALDPKNRGFGPFMSRVFNAVEKRQIDLEMELARAYGVPVHRIRLRVDPPVETWDFRRGAELIPAGYEITKEYLANMGERSGSRLRRFADWLRSRIQTKREA